MNKGIYRKNFPWQSCVATLSPDGTRTLKTEWRGHLSCILAIRRCRDAVENIQPGERKVVFYKDTATKVCTRVWPQAAALT